MSEIGREFSYVRGIFLGGSVLFTRGFFLFRAAKAPAAFRLNLCPIRDSLKGKIGAVGIDFAKVFAFRSKFLTENGGSRNLDLCKLFPRFKIGV